MADDVALMEEITALLKTLPEVTVYDGIVPEKLPTDGVYIRPYVVLWAGVGGDPREVASSGEGSSDSTILDFQTTAVGATSTVCRQVAQALKKLLGNARIGTGRIRMNPDGFVAGAPTPDTSESPAVFLLPLQWRLISN